MRLRGKKALVTAAAQGIGRSISETFIAEGAEVIAVDLNLDLLSTLKGAEVMKIDVTNKQALTGVIERANFDILANCAGIVHHGTVLEATEEELDLAFNLNVKSMFYGIQAALPGMKKRGGGSIINIASVCSSILAAPNRFVYGTTKAAIIGLTKSVAIEYITDGIRCNSICPGTVDSPSLHQRLKDTGDYEKAMKEFVARQRMGRIGAPDEIAAMALYLASDDSKFTTGQSHIVDGGWALG
ncbi:MAG: SDR family oxidoreductase [Paracoccaceae bacterium]|nr:SDR family oxidoreductase [Paracoccaceae bacterium]